MANSQKSSIILLIVLLIIGGLTNPTSAWQVVATVGEDATELKAVRVLNPDGSLAAGCEVATTAYNSVQFDPLAKQTDDNLLSFSKLGDDALLTRDMLEDVSFVDLWNAHGYLKLASSRVFDESSVQLVPWTSGRASLTREGKPAAGVQIRAFTRLTSDGLFQSTRAQFDAITDDQGVASFPKLPVGELTIQVEPRSIQKPNMSTSTYDRLLNVRSKVGEPLDVRFGQGRSIIGRIRMPDGDTKSSWSNLRGQISVNGFQQEITIQIDEDGLFRANDVPYGTHRIRIDTFYSPIGERLLCIDDIVCDPKGSELAGAIFVGNAYLETIADRRKRFNVTITEPQPPVAATDDFQTESTVALVATLRDDKSNHPIVSDSRGEVIRQLDELAIPDGGVNMSNFVTFDRPRGRLYSVSTSEDDSTNQDRLHTFDLSGKQLFHVDLPSGSHRIAADTENGTVWILSSSRLKQSVIFKLSSEGELLQTLHGSAFNFGYSPQQKVIWTVGDRVEKIESQSTLGMASSPVYDDCFVLSDVIPDGASGCFVVEVLHPDKIKSRNRIMRFNASAEQSVKTELGNFSVRRIAMVGNELWLYGNEIDGLWSLEKLTPVCRRYTPDLTFIAAVPDVDALSGTDRSDAWVSRNGFVEKVTVNDAGEIEVLESQPQVTLGQIWAS